MSTNDNTEEINTEPIEEAHQKDAPQERGNREAAKYRKQLREVETERDQLTGQNAALRSTVVQLHARAPIMIDAGAWSGDEEGNRTPTLQEATLLQPEDLFTLGKINPDELFDAEGNFDTDAFQEAASELYKKRSELFQVKPLPVKTIGSTADNLAQPDEGWSGAFSPKK